MKNPFLVYQAKAFYNAYIALEQLKPEDALLLVVPRLVNGSFSVELIIKAILTEKNIAYEKDHNLKVLFEMLPLDIQEKIWQYLVEKAPEYSDKTKRENELLLMSETFVKWRYYFEEKIVPAFDSRFLSAFSNAAICEMFDMGLNVSFEMSEIPVSSDEYREIDKKFEENRNQSMIAISEIITKHSGRKK